MIQLVPEKKTLYDNGGFVSLVNPTSGWVENEKKFWLVYEAAAHCSKPTFCVQKYNPKKVSQLNYLSLFGWNIQKYLPILAKNIKQSSSKQDFVNNEFVDTN